MGEICLTLGIHTIQLQDIKTTAHDKNAYFSDRAVTKIRITILKTTGIGLQILDLEHKIS